MWNGYSTREAAEFVGLPESAVRGCVRAGFLMPEASGVAMRFSFRDLRVLQVVKALLADGIPLRRVRRQLTALHQRLPDTRSLAELSLTAHAGHVVVREDRGAWRADTGQMVFSFRSDEGRGEMHAMPIRREAPGPEVVVGMTADEWFERAVALEEVDTEQAIEAYERAVALRRDLNEAWINLGRLHAESGHTEEAGHCFQQALALDPADPTAIYNLGVVAQDAGDDTQAIAHYQNALRINPDLAEAHYNLATIFDRAGDAQVAIRHINEYRKLLIQRRDS